MHGIGLYVGLYSICLYCDTWYMTRICRHYTIDDPSFSPRVATILCGYMYFGQVFRTLITHAYRENVSYLLIIEVLKM